MTRRLSQLTGNNRQQFSGSIALAGLAIVLIVFLMLGLAACQPESETADPGEEVATQEQSSTSPADSSEEAEVAAEDPAAEDPAMETEPNQPPPDPDALWLSSSHANTFVMGDDGTNIKCARCHAPIQYVPSMDEIPESCLTCKFEVEPPPPVVVEADWEHVPCQVCHKVKKDEVQPEFLWLEIAQIEEYAELESTTELCLKCHAGADVPGHEEILFTEVHQDLTCTECHDAHGNSSGCSKSGCHEDALDPAEPIAGHDEDHELVSCMACHDAAGLEVGLDEEVGLWTTFLATDGGETLTPLVTHEVQLEADCERCHFSDNPWGLSESVSPES